MPLTASQDSESTEPPTDLPLPISSVQPPVSLSIQVVDPTSDAVDLQAAWGRLAGPIPFCQSEWLATWWRHYRTPHSAPLMLCVRTPSEAIVGLAPWYVERSSLWGQVIKFLGSGEVCTDGLNILADPAYRTHVIDALADWLMGPGRDHWDAIEFEAVSPESQNLLDLIARLQASGHTIYRRPQQSSWQITLPATWDEYVAQLSKSRRERVRALVRRQFDTGRVVPRLLTDPRELPRAFHILTDLHQKRWESAGEPGCFASPRFTAFHVEATALMLKQRRLRMHWVEVEGQPAAIEYGVTSADTVFYYQAGYDPALADERPGWLELIASIRLAIEQGYRTFDFLRGDEAYKASWRAEPIALERVQIFGRGATSRCRKTAWTTALRAKDWLTRCRHWVGPERRRNARKTSDD